MMERRRALKIPFTKDKDNLMGSPFKIPIACISPERAKFEKQVSWTEVSGRRHCDSHHKNASKLFGHNHDAMVTLEMGRRKPRLILTDILKTEQGKAYMERTKGNHILGNRGQVSSMHKEDGCYRDSSLNCRERRSSLRVARTNGNKSATAKCSQQTTSSPSQRSKRRSQNDDKEEKDIQEVIIGKDCGQDYRFAEVVDCGLSVSWEPAENTEGCKEFSPTRVQQKCADPDREVQDSSKRKRRITKSLCNGTDSPKRHRESVLHLTGEDGGDGEPLPSPVYPEESREDLDRSILRFTVGDDPTDALAPVISASLETGDLLDTSRHSLSSSRDNTTQTGHSEPIVLSSDDEESCDASQHHSPLVHSAVAVQDTVIQEAEAQQEEPSHMDNMQLLHVVVEDLPPVAVSLISNVQYSYMAVAFSAMYCGARRGNSNGDMMVMEHEIVIPLKDVGEQVDMVLTIQRKELRRYSVWDQEELEDQDLHFQCDEEPLPPAALLLFVSEMAAAAAQQDLRKLRGQNDETTNTEDKASPFILLTLRDPLEGMEGALLRSLLDIDCLNSFADSKCITSLEDFQNPVLSLNDSIELILTTGLGSNLLSLLGLNHTDPQLSSDQDCAQSDTENSASPSSQSEVDSQQETIGEFEAATERERTTQLEPEEIHKEHDLEDPPVKREEENTPAYTICHRRTKASYSVSMCKLDSSWTKYKHKGLAHRLIQFPPPPLKGGITVTMEDLQCLDSGQFLNDVIIDFYLKYLLHKASAAVTERSHIFSSFFYKQLTRRDNASEGSAKDSCQRQRRHQRVKTWTRHVDIFKKDFLFVPVNQEAHWYLVVICFPGLEEPTFEALNDPSFHMGKLQSGTVELQEQEAIQGYESPSDHAETPPTPPTVNHDDNLDTEAEKTQEEPNKDTKPGPVSCTERTFQKKAVCKRPCILVMDSLKRSPHERVFKLLRDYLESEWEVRRGSSRDFNADQMQSSHCKVPLQDNSSDCGLYLLQYVESFLEDPVVHFDLPLQLQRWFPRQQVRRKRDEIRNLVLRLYRCQSQDDDR